MTRKERILYRRRQVAEIMARGIDSRRFIAKAVGCGLATAQRDIDYLMKMVHERTIARAVNAKVMQLESIQWRRSEIMEAWIKSKESAETETTEDSEKGTKTSRTVKRQYGDPRLMAEWRELDVREDSLLNLSDKDDSGKMGTDWRGLSREELMNRFREKMRIVPTKNQENGN